MVKYIQNYALYESIGSGVYGKVYRAINNNDKKEYAVKVIPIAKFRENKKLEECTVNEINILTNIENNQHIIRYFDMLKTSNNFYFIYEFCNGGTLEGLLSKQGKLSEQSALLIFKQLLEAFQVLNKYNIMHRDMKPDNIFFNNGVIKLGDFGFCKNLNSADEMTTTMLGSPIYMAPEVLKGETYSNKADIWSLGVVLYEMLFGHCPFQSNSIAKLIQVLDTQELEVPNTVSSFLRELIVKMLTKDAAKRIAWVELFAIKINNEGSIENKKVPQNITSLTDDDPNSLHNTKYTPIVKKQNTAGQLGGITGPTVVSTSQKPQPSSTSTSTSQSAKPSSSHSMGENNFKKTTSNRASCKIVVDTVNGLNGSQHNNNNNVEVPSPGLPPSSSSSASSKISEEHKMVLQGVKLSMQVIEARLSSYSGFTNLILSKNISIIEALLHKPFRREILEILDKELKDMKAEKQTITGKMSSYELKGLEDWKKYMRNKFFEGEKNLGIWYRMVSFLSGKSADKLNMNLSQTQMVQAIKSLLH